MYIRQKYLLDNDYKLTHPGVKEYEIASDKDFIFTLPIIDGDRVLDIGCGLGRDAKALLLMYPNIELVCLDKQKLLNDSSLIFILGEITNLPFRNKEFDIVYTNGVLGELTEEEASKAIKELKRVGKKSFYTEIFYDLTFARVSL